MYSSGQMQLQSASWLNGHTGDRPSFEALVLRTFSTQNYKVFAMPQGLLFLQIKKKAGDVSDPNKGAIVAGAVLGGMLGAAIAAGIANSMSNPREVEQNYDLLSEEELLALVRTRRKSFVVKNEDVTAVSIEAPGGWARLFGDNNLAGNISMRTRTQGTVKMEVHDQASLSVAVDALPRRLGQRVLVNVELDRRSAKFVARGRG